MAKPIYRVGDKVWVFVDPRSLADAEEHPVFQVEVEVVSTVVKLDYINPAVVVHTYDLLLEWDSLSRVEGDIYATEADAIKAGLGDVIKLRDRAWVQHQRYQKLVSEMECGDLHD